MKKIPEWKINAALHWWQCLLTPKDRQELIIEYNLKTVRDVAELWINKCLPFEHLRNDL